MTPSDEFIENLYREFQRRQRSPNLIQEYFYNKERWIQLQDQAQSLGLYFWIHLNFTPNTCSILRIGDIEEQEKRRSLCEDSDSEDEFSDNLVSSREIEARSLPYIPGESELEESSDEEISLGSQPADSVLVEPDILSVSTPSTTHSVQLSDDSYWYIRAVHRGNLPEFPIEFDDTSDDESCVHL
jgi:hypothetical protein